MTLQITSFEHGREVAENAMSVVCRFAPRAYLAGGFLRDIDNGVQPKDLDFFMEGVRTPTGGTEGTDQLAQSIFEAFGHKFKVYEHNALNNDQAYPEFLRVYESTEYPDDHFPLNLIFTSPGTQHPLEFDVGLCDIMMYNNAIGAPEPQFRIYRSNTYDQDKEDGVLTINRIEDAYLQFRQETPLEVSLAKLVGHINRIKAKYPERPVVVGQFLVLHQTAARTNALMTALKNGGIIGDPREILPAEGQVPLGDPVRLEDGAEGLGGIEQGAARRDPFNADWLVQAQAAVVELHNTAQVQPGLTTRAARGGRGTRRTGRAAPAQIDVAIFNEWATTATVPVTPATPAGLRGF